MDWKSRMKRLKSLMQLRDKEPVLLDEQPTDVMELVDYIKGEFERRADERRPFELQWRLNQNFLTGNQFCDINMATGELDSIEPAYDWMQGEVYNHLAPTIETRLAKLGRVQPGLAVRPATSDTSDIAAARMSSKLLKGMAAAHKLGKKNRDAQAWCELLGTAFIRVGWDKDGGKVLGEVSGRVVREGDLSIDVIPAYEMYPDFLTREDVDECESLIHARVCSVTEIERRWGERLPGRELDVFELSNTGMIVGGTGYNPGMQTIVKGTMQDAELVIEYMERPRPDLPEGRLAIVAGDRLMHLGPLPWTIGEYGERGFPFARMICTANPGFFFGMSIIERLIPVQRAYNAVQNRIHEHIARQMLGVLVYKTGSLPNADDVIYEGLPPGSVVEYTGDAPPHWLESAPLPPSLVNERDSLEQQFILISGTSEISRNSSAPSSSMSGVALELLKEQDDTRLSATAENVRDCIRACGVIMLRMLRQFAVGARLTRMCGENEDVDVLLWQGSDLTSDDVVLDTDNELSNTPAQRKQTALELFKAGLFNDPETGALSRTGRMQLLRVFEIGNWEDITDLDELQRQAANREQRSLEGGETPQINELDDHNLHVLEHTKYVYSAQWRELKERNEHLAGLMLQHIAQHRQALQQMAAAQIQAQNSEIEEAARAKLELETMTDESPM